MSSYPDRKHLVAAGFIAACFLSGGAALIYETVWIHWFKILFGSTAHASAATLSAFFTGLAIGAALFGKLAHRFKKPLIVYAWIELGVIASVLIVPQLIKFYDLVYPSLYSTAAASQHTFTLIKFALAFIAILPGTILLGGTLPILVTAYVRGTMQLGIHGGTLYSINTLGAAAGAAAAALWLIREIGINATYYTGFICTALSAAIALMIHYRTHQPAASQPEETKRSTHIPRKLLTIAFASGFGTLALEVLLIHAMSQIIDNTIYSFGVILVVVLVALATSAMVVARNYFRVEDSRLLTLALLAEAVLLLLLPVFIIEMSGNLERIHAGTLINGILIATGIAGPALFIGGMVLPLTFRLASGGIPGVQLGGLLAANTIGGVLGSIVAGFFMLDLFGIWPSIAILGACYAIAAMVSLEPGRAMRLAAIITAVTITGILISNANPWTLPIVALNPGERLVAAKETSQGVITVIDRPAVEDRRIKVNNHYSLSGSGARVNVERAGHIPLLLHPDPEKVLYIGTATGITAGAATLHPVRKIVLVEIIPEVQELAARYFADYNNQVYDDARSQRIAEDGRNHVRATDETYDVIVGDLFVPWHPGAGSLYSREHFQSVKDHLTDNGLFAQWLPVFQLTEQELRIIAATFIDVFPNAVVWRGNFSSRLPRIALVGHKSEIPDATTIKERIQTLEGKSSDRWITDETGFWMLYAGQVSHLHGIENERLNTDDTPIFEFVSGKSTHGERRNFGRTGWLEISTAISPREHMEDPVYQGMPPAAPAAGLLYYQADAQHMNERADGWTSRSAELRLLLRKLRDKVPESLLYPPDPSVADVRP